MVDQEDHDGERSIGTRQKVRIVVWVVALAAVLLLAAVNTQQVQVDWVFGDSKLALWVVIAGSALLGGVVGYVARWRRD